MTARKRSRATDRTYSEEPVKRSRDHLVLTITGSSVLRGTRFDHTWVCPCGWHSEPYGFNEPPEWYATISEAAAKKHGVRL